MQLQFDSADALHRPPPAGLHRPAPETLDAWQPCRRNSPEAAGRVLALALVVDGQVSTVELSRLEELDAHTRLGLRRPAWLRLLHDVRDDLLGRRPYGAGGPREIDADTIARVLADIDEPALCATLLTLCRAAVGADRVVTAGEARVIAAAEALWSRHLRAGTAKAAA